MGKVYRIGTFKIRRTVTIGDKNQGHQQAMDIIFCLAGVIEKRELLKNYPRLGIEVNGVPMSAEDEGGWKNEIQS